MTFPELEAIPEFTELSYNEQLDLRTELFNKNYGRDPGFLGLPDEEKAKFIDQTLFRPPVLKDKQLEQQLGQVAQRFLAGDEDAKKFMQREVNIGAFQNQSTIAKLFDKMLVSGPIERAQEQSGDDPFGHGDIVMSKDQKNALAYFDTLLSQSSQAVKRSKVVQPLLSIAGAVTDFALMFALTGGSAVGPRAMLAGGKSLAGSPKALGKAGTALGQLIWDRAKSTGTKHLGMVVGQAGHASVTAGLGLGREYVKSWLNDEEMPVERRDFLEKSARWYGGYFAGDLIMNIVTGYMAPVLKSMGKIYSGATTAERLYLATAKADMDEFLQLTIAGKHIPKYLLETVPESIQQRIISQVKGVNTIMNTPVASADEIANLVGGANGFELRLFDGPEIMERLSKSAGRKVKARVRLKAGASDDTVSTAVRRKQRATQKAERHSVLESLENVTTFEEGRKYVGIYNPDPGNPTKMLYSDPLSTVEEYNAWMMATLDKVRSDVRTIFEAGTLAGDAGLVRIRRHVDGVLKLGDDPSQEMLAQMITPIDGKVPRSGIETFTRTLMKQEGIDDAAIKKFKVWSHQDPGAPGGLERGYYRLATEDSYVDFKYMDVSPAQERKQLEEISAWIGNKKRKKLPVDMSVSEGHREFTATVREGFLKYFRNSDERISFSSPAFLDDLASKRLHVNLMKRGDSWFLGKEKFTSLDDAGDAILRRVADPEHVHRRMYRDFGLNLRVNSEEGTYSIVRNNKIQETFGSMDDLLAVNPQYVPKISAENAPLFSIVNKDLVPGGEMTMLYQDKVVYGNLSEVKEFLSNFKDYDLPEESVVSLSSHGKNKIMFDRATQVMEVEIPEIAYRASFNSIDEAKSFLSAWTQTENLEKIALSKGFRLKTTQGKYLIYSGDGQKHVLDTMDAVKAKLKEVPTPEYVPELTGADDELVRQFWSKELADAEVFKPETFTLPGETLRAKRDTKRLARYRKKTGDPKAELGKGIDADYRLSTLVGNYTLPPRQLFEKIAADGGSTLPLEWYDNLEKSLQLARGEAAQYYAVIDRAFRKADGKAIPYRKRIGIRDLLEASDPTKRAAIIKQHGLLPDELVVEQNIRKLFGESPERGFALAFDLNPEDFLTNYFPRIRTEYLDKNVKMRLAAAPDAKTALKILYNNNVPPPMGAFFKKARKNDVLKFAAVDDPLEALHIYVKTGLKDRYVTPTVKSAIEAVSEKRVGTMAFQQFKRYVADIGNFPQGTSDTIMREITPRFLVKMGLPPGLSQDISKLVMSGGYLSLMGFRPWLPLRNMMQIYTMLAPRVGNEWVQAATQIVADDTTGEIFTRLRRMGVLQENLPLFGSEAFDASKGIGKLTHAGLKWYKNSDDVERAIAFVAAEERFKHASKDFLTGKYGDITSKRAQSVFADLAGWKTLSLQQQQEMQKYLVKKQFTKAGEYFGSRITELTMFPYRAGTSPLVFSGTFGKVFGMMGHYPVYYVDNLRRMVQHMSPGELMVAGSTFAMNSMALYGFYKYVMGVEARNFLPWNPAMFGGGPMFDLSVQGLDLIGGGDMEKKQALTRILGVSTTADGELNVRLGQSQLVKNLVPGSYQMRSIVRAWEAWDNGDLMAALNGLMSAPMSPDEYLLDG